MFAKKLANVYNSVSFQASNLRFCMEVYMKPNAKGQPFVSGPFLMFIFGPFLTLWVFQNKLGCFGLFGTVCRNPGYIFSKPGYKQLIN